MGKGIGASLLLLLLTTGLGGAAAQSSGNQQRASGMETDVAKIKEAIARKLGEHRRRDPAEQEPGRLAQAVLSQARFQI